MAEWIKIQLRRLGVLAFPPDDDVEHVRDIEQSGMTEPILRAAVDYAIRTRTKFPAPAELRADADHVAPLARLDVPLPVRERVLEQPFTITIPEVGTVVSVTREWKYYCDDCSDTGWKSFWCGDAGTRRQPWIEFGKCERPQEHGAHEFVQHCACWASNPALIRKRDAVRKYSEPPQKVA
jgi:hypothetical protein